jgi:hypothetical protein
MRVMVTPSLELPWELEPSPGEVVVWEGRPSSRLRVAVTLWPLGLIVGGYIFFLGIFLQVASLRNDPFSRIGGYVVLAGLALLTPPFLAWVRAKGTRYVLTDMRAVVLQRSVLGKAKVRSFDAARLHDMRVRERGDGSGDLVFEGWLKWPVGFLAVQDVRQVESLVRMTLKK